MASNYPPGVNVLDPMAPWNRSYPPRSCNTCDTWDPCPYCGRAGYCPACGEYVEQDVLDECAYYSRASAAEIARREEIGL